MSTPSEIVSSESEAPVTARVPGVARGSRAAVKTVGDMLRSLAFVLLSVVVLFGGFLFVAYRYHGAGSLNRVDDDLAGEIPIARLQAPFPFLAPVGLPHAWAPTSVSWIQGGAGAPAVFHVGWVTPKQKFLDLEESSGEIGPLLAGYEKSPVPDGTAVVAGVTYQVSRSTDGSLTYQSVVGIRHLGVTGGAGKAEIEQLLTSLH